MTTRQVDFNQYQHNSRDSVVTRRQVTGSRKTASSTGKSPARIASAAQVDPVESYLTSVMGCRAATAEEIEKRDKVIPSHEYQAVGTSSA
jgi:hypothetical protein